MSPHLGEGWLARLWLDHDFSALGRYSFSYICRTNLTVA